MGRGEREDDRGDIWHDSRKEGYLGRGRGQQEGGGSAAGKRLKRTKRNHTCS